MAKKMSPGDVVVMRSGGPQMTVRGVAATEHEAHGKFNKVSCLWFDKNDERHLAWFHENMLEVVSSYDAGGGKAAG